MPQEWQGALQILGFTSFWSTLFFLAAYLGLIICTWGICDKKRQPELFLSGAFLFWAFALFGGDPVFIGAQSIIGIASFLRIMKTPRSPYITLFCTFIIVTSMLARGDFNSVLQIFGAGATLGLAFGMVLTPRLWGNIFFAVGGGLMIYYAHLVGSLPFFLLNIPFTATALWEINKAIRTQNRP